jgi:hypothetical protein
MRIMPLPLTNLHIGGFRGITNLDIEDIQRVNVLFGDNNAGKTTILEAISVLAKPFDWSNWISVARSRDFVGFASSRRISRLEPLMWLFPRPVHVQGNPRHSSINLSCTGQIHVIDLTADISEVFGSLPESPSSRQFLSAYDGPISEVRTGAELTVATSVTSDGPITGVAGLEVWAPTGFQPGMYVNQRKVGLTPLTAFGDGFRRRVSASSLNCAHDCCKCRRHSAH